MKKSINKVCKNIISTCIFAVAIICLQVIIPNKMANAQYVNKPRIIYSTDLTKPPGDPDDHFDLLSLFSLNDVSIEAVILDYPWREIDRERGRKPNFNALQKASVFFNRKEVPCRAGLRRPLESPGDKGLDRPEEEQKAISLIIDRLKSSPSNGVVFITTGSLRDICAAYNRKPELFKKKVHRMIFSIGDSYGLVGTDDTNTSLDVEAWKGLMSSDLPIYWMPCNPSKGRGGPSRYVSYWYFIQSELAPHCPKSIEQFLKSDGIDLSRPVQRHMWSTPAFIEAAGLKCYRAEGKIKWLTKQEAKTRDKGNTRICKPFEFIPIRFSLNDKGIAVWEKAQSGKHTNIWIIRINDYYLYNEAMFQFLKDQFNNAGKES
jgi:hypothetical protein